MAYAYSYNDILSADFITSVGDVTVVSKLIAVPDHVNNVAQYKLVNVSTTSEVFLVDNNVRVKFGMSLYSYADAKENAKEYPVHKVSNTKLSTVYNEISTLGGVKSLPTLIDRGKELVDCRCNDYGSPRGPEDGVNDNICIYCRLFIGNTEYYHNWNQLEKSSGYQTSAMFAYLCDTTVPEFFTSKGTHRDYRLDNNKDAFYGLKIFAKWPDRKFVGGVENGSIVHRAKSYPDGHYLIKISLSCPSTSNEETKETIDAINDSLNDKWFTTTNSNKFRLSTNNNSSSNDLSSIDGCCLVESDGAGGFVINERNWGASISSPGSWGYTTFWHKFDRTNMNLYNSSIVLTLTNSATERSNSVGKQGNEKEYTIQVDLESPKLDVSVDKISKDDSGKFIANLKIKGKMNGRINSYMHFISHSRDDAYEDYAAIFHKIANRANWYEYDTPSIGEAWLKKYPSFSNNQVSIDENKVYTLPVRFSYADVSTSGLEIDVGGRRDMTYSYDECSINLKDIGVFIPNISYTWKVTRVNGITPYGELTVTNNSVGKCDVTYSVNGRTSTKNNLSSSGSHTFKDIPLDGSSINGYTITAKSIVNSAYTSEQITFEKTYSGNIDAILPVLNDISLEPRTMSGDTIIMYEATPPDAVLYYDNNSYRTGGTITFDENTNSNYNLYLKRTAKDNNSNIATTNILSTKLVENVDTRYPTVTIENLVVEGDFCTFTLRTKDSSGNPLQCDGEVYLYSSEAPEKYRKIYVGEFSRDIEKSFSVDFYAGYTYTIIVRKMHNVANSIRVDFNFNDNKVFFDRCAKVYIDGEWKNIIAYVYEDGKWRVTEPYAYCDGRWRPVKL